jgi:hypothetical protein
MKNEYVLKKCNDMLVWDALVNESQQGSIFSKSTFLQSLDSLYSCYLVTTPHGEVVAGAAILHYDQEIMAPAPFEFVPFQGIIFSKHVSALNLQKKTVTEFRITSFIIQSFLTVYTNFNMSLSPNFKDLRPFLWYNYDNKLDSIFEIKQKYTGILSLDEKNLNYYLNNLRAVRRQEYKKTTAEILVTFDLEQFLILYRKTFERQGIQVDIEKLNRIYKICKNAMDEGFGNLSCAIIDNKISSMAFFVNDQNTAYYLFGVNDPSLRNESGSSKILIDNILRFAQQGLKKFDFVGVNSPNRGDFKMSFGAELIGYNQISLVKNAKL